VTKRMVRLPSDNPPFLDLVGHSKGSAVGKRFNIGQLAQIHRTVNRAPEVMVKVTGGGRRVRAVAEHLSYISHHGEIEIETDQGQRISKTEHRDLLKDWHLDLTTGQYRPRADGRTGSGIKLVHNIVLSMPAPTPPDKVLAAARNFAREKFALNHSYVMALHIHQRHPHVHLVVKAEGRDGRRLHIDKAMLREWRQEFARMMREQGIAANATPRVVRGQGKRAERDGAYRTRRRGSSKVLNQKLKSIVSELATTRTIRDPAHTKLAETRKGLVSAWMDAADALQAQGELTLAHSVRRFANSLPPVRTDRERLAAQLIAHLKSQRPGHAREVQPAGDRTQERSR